MRRIVWLCLVGVVLGTMPAFAADVLTDFNGSPQQLTKYTGKGKWLVVMIWASDCHVCNAEVHNYVDFQTFHSQQDATVLGVSMDGVAKKKDALAFIKRHEVNFPNLIGEPEAVAKWYTQLTDRPWVGTPSFLIYSPAGELKAQQVGAVPPELIEAYIKSHASGS